MDASFIRFSYFDHELPDEWLLYSAYLEYVLDETNPVSHYRKSAEYLGDLPQQISELQARINWRKMRRSPPKCLHCGSSEILPIPEAEEFDHPVTGFRMKVEGQGFATTDGWRAEYTPEGDLIDRNGGLETYAPKAGGTSVSRRNLGETQQ